MTEKELRKKAMALPLQPGVYIMKDKSKKIIYIGKAKKLKNRVSSYFGSHSGHSLKVVRMVQNVDDFDYILVDTEFEALVLECSLIKQHMPKYNILLKDDKGYNYIKITKGDFPRISECKRIDNDGAEYIGPYISGYSVKQAAQEVLRIFKLPRCSKSFPRDYGKSRPCLNGFMGICCAPCAGKISQEEFKKTTEDAVAFLKGGSKAAVREMTQRMNELSEELRFEEAAALRDRIRSVKNLEERQKVVSINVPEEDVFALVCGKKKACFEVIRFKNGKLSDTEYWLIDSQDDPASARLELIERYYSIRNDIPSRIAVDGDIEDEELLRELLEKQRGKKTEFIHPQKGEHLSILNMCIKNANEHLAQSEGRLGREFAALEELASLLGLPKPPEYIESYDISHTFGADNVAGMVVFHNGRPMRSAYKRFAVKGFDGQNDVGSMNEVLAHVADYMDRRTSSKVAIIREFPAYDVTVKMSAPLFEWVIENLCKNAVDAMEGSGTIRICLIDEAERVAVEVHDTGKGIRKKDLGSVFAPGFTTKKRGWGLGLSLAKRIVEEYHRGRIFVKSTEVGRGTVFRVELRKR